MNIIGSRQWRLDTANPGVVIWPANMKIKAVEFAGYSTQGNLLILKDQNGNIAVQLSGASDLETVRTPSDVGWVNGLIVDTLQGNGIATVFLA